MLTDFLLFLRMLTGYYCFGKDIDKKAKKKPDYENYRRFSYVSDVFLLDSEDEYSANGKHYIFIFKDSLGLYHGSLRMFSSNLIVIHCTWLSSKCHGWSINRVRSQPM